MIKKIIPVIVILVVLLIIYNLINQISTSFKAGEILLQAADKVNKLEIKNKELKKRLSEIKSPAFIEQQARDKLGLSKEGETVVVIPQEKIKQVLGEKAVSVPRLPNWQGWLRLFWK